MGYMGRSYKNCLVWQISLRNATFIFCLYRAKNGLFQHVTVNMEYIGQLIK